MNTYKNIERLYNVVYKSIARIDGNLSYYRTLDAINRLCDVINEFYDDEENEGECIWSIGEYNELGLDSLIVGAYWFTSDYTNGQASQENITYCSLGTIFNPGMSYEPEEDTSEAVAYELLEQKHSET